MVKLSSAKLPGRVESPVGTWAGFLYNETGIDPHLYARSGDPVVLTAYMGGSEAFEDALADFGVAYAAQNERDHAVLLAAIRSGRIEASAAE